MSLNRKLQLESLQRRELLAADSLVWENASSLRLSFVPDGARVGDEVSNLNAVMSSSMAGTNWRASVVEAFQIWSQYAAINVGVVEDSGDPIGALGPVRADDRFGEIRIAGVPMTADTWAAAVDHEKVSAGSWAGDMFFNTDANWNQHPDDLLRVALHEAGHVLGLPHSDDPNSPMHTHGVPSSITPTAADIALLQQMYGVRQVDANEVSKANDKPGDATRMRFSDISSHFDGSKPLVHYGEIQNSSDRDIFFFETPNGYTGSTSVYVITGGLSQLQLRLTISDINGHVLQTADSQTNGAGSVKLTLPGTSTSSRYYLQIDAIGDAQHQFGSYAVVTELDGRITVPHADTVHAVQKAHRWFASSPTSLGNFDVGTLAASQRAVNLVEDNGTDDDALHATRIDPFIDNAIKRSSRTIGTISSSSDVDYFRFKSPRPASGTTFGMILQIDAIERNGLLPQIEVLDSLGHVLTTETLVNGNGEVKLWLPDVANNTDYTVRVSGRAEGFNIGNYEIISTFQETRPTRDELVRGQLTKDKPETQFAWYVARPQLFTLALESTFTGSQSVPVWATIYDSGHRVVSHLAAETGTLRTGPSALLLPGTYYLQFGTDGSLPALAGNTIDVSLLGVADIDPLGPPPVDPATSPVFSCPDTTGEFCYPPDVRTTKSFVLLDFPNEPLPTTINSTINVPPSTWFYNDLYPRSNFAQPLDTSGDGTITPLDALLVINYINTRGAGRLPAPPVVVAGMIDTNNDSIASAIDALLVINYLNSRPPASGEANVDTWPHTELLTVSMAADLSDIEALRRSPATSAARADLVTQSDLPGASGRGLPLYEKRRAQS